jgi:hypothetical protein
MLCLLNHQSRANTVPIILGGDLWDRRTIRSEPRFPRRGHLPTERIRYRDVAQPLATRPRIVGANAAHIDSPYSPRIQTARRLPLARRARNYQCVYSGGGAIWKKIGNLERRFVRRPSAISGGYGILIAAYRTVNHSA